MFEKSTNKLLILVDGSSYLHRAFHALPPLTNAKGEPTGAIYGVINMLRKLLDEYRPDYVAMVFDSKEKNFRHELYSEYKATRPTMEDDLKLQIEPLHAIIKAMGVKLLIMKGIEADDLIGTLARRAEQMGMQTIISTGDKDMAQLVGPHIKLINTMNDSHLDERQVMEKFGVAPRQMVDYLTLVGDSSDNILGVNGVGPKTAAKWLKEYDTLENIIEHRNEITGKVGNNLQQSIARLPMVKNLVTIRDDLEIEWSPEKLTREQPRVDQLVNWFTRFEFRSWLRDLAAKDNSGGENYKLILNSVDFESLLKHLQQSSQFAFDLETTSLEIVEAEIVGISFAVKPREGWYIPLAHDYEGVPQQLDCGYVLEKLRPIFADNNRVKLGQNLKHDISILANYGISVVGSIYDTMVEAYLVNSSQSRYDKESLALRYLGRVVGNYEDMVGKGAKQIPFSQVTLERAMSYAILDVDLVLQLHGVLWPELEKNNLQRLCQKIDLPLIQVLSRMERYGVVLDCDLLHNYSLELGERLQQLEQKIYTLSGTTFNIGSPQQLQEVLFTKLGLPILQKTPGGQPSTAESVLQELAMDYPLPELLLEYRGLTKLKSTYTDALPRAVNRKTRRVHTSYNQTVTTTGRLSSTNPNLQNIPIRTEEGRLIRRAFITRPGYKIISADYSQIELRIMAHLAQDQNLIDTLCRGVDVHRMVAAEIFNVAPEAVTEAQRRNAKTINFGLIYGMSAFGLMKRLNISREVAEKYMEIYFHRYPKVNDYMQEMRRFASEHGFIESILGRRLHINDIKAKNYARRQAAERAAINAPIQGSAADIIKLAMIELDHWIVESGHNLAMIMQVHDELVFEVAESCVDIAVAAIKDKMENAVQLAVPLIVAVGVGHNWDEAH